MDAAKTVMILGGGVGGVIAARELRKRLPRPHRVVLVERERQHLFAPSLLWLMVGQRESRAIQRPFERLEQRGIELHHGEIEEVDPEARRVTVSGKTIDADYLIVSLGAERAPEIVPGLQGAGHNFYTRRSRGVSRGSRAAEEGTPRGAHGRAGLQVPGGAVRGSVARRRLSPRSRPA